MVFKRFRLQLISRVIAIGLTMALLILLIFHTTLIATTVLISLLLIYQVMSLIQFVDKTNQQLTRFFEAIRHADFSQSFSTLGLGKSFEGLSRAFTEVADEFRRARAEKEEQFRYLQTLVQHIGVGVIAFTDNGKVELINQAAKRVLGINHLINIEKLGELDESLPKMLRQLEAGQRTLVKLTIEYDTLQLAVHATKIRRGTDILTLVSIQNIGSELAEQEMIAWQNLIRVLTHEIMNSITPIASLAGSVNDMVRTHTESAEFLQSRSVEPEIITDLTEALTTIEKRSQGLLHFVQAYRNLTRIPKPDFRFVSAQELLTRVQQLMQAQALAENIAISMAVDPPELELTCDSSLIEQVLINLVLNSIQALKGQANGTIDISARIGRGGRILIEVIDNGPGIIESAVDKIFIPFFTTKKGGTGIGLALARQIMRLHGGNITVRSAPNKQTVFTLSF